MTAEMFNLFATTLGSGLMTYLANWQTFKHEENKLRHDREMAVHKANEEAQTKAREFKSDKGFHLTRRAIALMVVISVVVVPIIAPIFFDVSVVFGTYATSNGILPWQVGSEHVEWIAVGSASRTFVIPPFVTNICTSIIGFFFGNQICKR